MVRPLAAGLLRHRGALCGVELRLDLLPYRPDESKQLAADRRDDTAMMLALRRQFLETLVESVLCLPGDRFHLLILALLTLLERGPGRRPMSVRPRRFANDVSHPSVARLRDGPAMSGTATGVLARHDPHVGHQLAWA